MAEVHVLRIAVASVFLAGCAAPHESQSGVATRHAHGSIAEMGGDNDRAIADRPNGGTTKRTHAALPAVRLDAYEVHESAFTDFGMSVRTNVEVKWGGRIEWMRVSGIDAGASAAVARLEVGDRVLAIDEQLITDMNRDAMLEALFQRKKGDVAQFLVLGQKDPLPRFVRLVAGATGPKPAGE